MRILTLGLVLLAIAVVFAVTRFGGDEEDVGLVTVADGASDLEDAPIRDTARRTAMPRLAEPEEDSEDAGESESETEILRPGEGLVLQVVDPSGLPEAGAVVGLYKVPSLRPSMRREFLGLFGGSGESERTLLAEYTSDDEGMVELDRRLGPRIVAEARKGDLFGRYTAGAAGELPVPEGVEGLIVLEPVKFLDVRLIGPGGGNVPHVLVTASPDFESRSSRLDFGRGRRGRGRGRAGRRNMLFGGGLFLRQRSSAGNPVTRFEINSASALYDEESVAVTAQLFGLESPREVVTMKERGHTEVTLLLPPTVILDLSIRQSSGDLWTPPVNVTWDPLSPDTPQGGSPMRFFGRTMNSRLEVKGGKAFVGGFQPGGRFRFEVTDPQRVRASREVTVQNSPGTQPVTLEVGDRMARLVLHLSDDRGEPLAKETFTVAVVTDAPSSPEVGGSGRGFRRWMNRFTNGGKGSGLYRSDSEGRLDVPVPPGKGGRLELRPRSLSPFGRNAEESPPLATVEFSSLMPGQNEDLGDVVVDAGPLLVSGIAVDEEGVPQGGVRLRVRWQPDQSGEQSGGRRRRRMSSGSMTVTTDDNGAFEIHRQALPETSYGIEVDERNWVSARVPFQAGAQNIRVVLTAPGGLRGRVTVVPESLGVRPRLTLRPAGGEPAPMRGGRRSGPRVRVGADGAFVVRRVTPGLYDLEIRLGRVLVRTIPSLQVPSGEIAEPPELQDIIVGSEVVRAVVRVQDVSGNPIPGARVRYSLVGQDVPRQGRVFEEERTDESGEAAPLLPAGSLARIRVSSGKYVETSLESSAFPLTVTLEQGGTLIARFASPLPRVDGIRGYRVLLTPKKKGGASARSRTVPAGSQKAEVDRLDGQYAAALLIQPDFRTLFGAGQRGRSFRNVLRLTIPLESVDVPRGETVEKVFRVRREKIEEAIVAVKASLKEAR